MRININGAEINYSEAGDERNPAIIVLHGGRGVGNHDADFQAFLPLADSYRLIGFDMRGHGLSSLTPPYSFEQMADDVEGLRLGLCAGRQISLIAGSFGGMIGLTYALRYPQNLANLVLRGTAASHHHEADAFAEMEHRIDQAPMLTREMLEKEFSQDIADDNELRLIWFAMMPLYNASLDMNVALERARTAHIHHETHNALFAVKSYDVRDRLGEITANTLVVCGEDDWICPVRHSREMAEKIPGAELLVVPGCNHGVHIEANELVNAHIRRFLAGHPKHSRTEN